MKNLTIFGDSILKSVIYDSSRDKYGLFSKELFSEFEQGKYEIERFCHMGSKVDDGLFWINRCFEKSSPKNVLIEFGGNDSMHDWKQVSEHPEEEHFAFNPPETFKEKYQSAIDLLKKNGATVWVSNLLPIDAPKYMDFISRNLSYDNIVKWLGDTSMLYRWHENYNHIVEELARKNDCRILDLRSRFLLSHSFPDLIGGDGIHPTKEGHKIIEKTILEAMDASEE